MKLYKLSDEVYKTRGNTEWVLGKTNSLPECKNPKLCSKDVFHAYRSLNIGLLLNPRHADFKSLKAYLCEGRITIEDWDQVGSFKLTPVENIDIPSWYLNKKLRKRVQIQFALLCAEKVFPIFENEFYDGDLFKNTIDATKKYLKNPTTANAFAAGNLATALCSIDHATAYYAAHAAAWAAWSTNNTVDASYAATWAAAYSVYASRVASNITWITRAAEIAKTIQNASATIGYSCSTGTTAIWADRIAANAAYADRATTEVIRAAARAADHMNFCNLADRAVYLVEKKISLF